MEGTVLSGGNEVNHNKCRKANQNSLRSETETSSLRSRVPSGVFNLFWLQNSYLRFQCVSFLNQTVKGIKIKLKSVKIWNLN